MAGLAVFLTDDLHIVRQDDNGLYVDCDEGKHYLDGATDDGEHCISLCARRLDLTDRQLKLVRAAVAIAFVDDDAPVYDADDGYARVQAASRKRSASRTPVPDGSHPPGSRRALPSGSRTWPAR